MAEFLITTQSISPTTFGYQEYSPSDTDLIAFSNVETTFNPDTDYLEYYVYDLSGNILYENVSGFPNYKLIDNQVTIDPVLNLTSTGYEQGSYNTLYNFLRRRLGSDSTLTYYIDEISPDRTEIRLNTTLILNQVVINTTNEFINEIQNSPLDYVDFYLNFGSNKLVIANNILLDDTNPTDPTILIKLYEPLPSEISLKTPCWVVQLVAESVAYNISINSVFTPVVNNFNLKGPNFNLALQNQINNSTDYTNYKTLSSTSSSLSQGTGSLNYQLNNILAQTGITINVDYSDYANFIHFSSALTRLENFYYKLQLLEGYTYSASLSTTGSLTGSYYASSSNILWQAKINEIITTFDSYEYYLYYSSGSSSWPKTGNTPPYTNYSTTSTSGSNWFVSQSIIAEEYDMENNNALTLAIPSYILEDSDNAQFELFVEMVGQMFDNVFVYLQGVTSKYDADNRLTYGVSKDLVADILRDMGITIYQNNFSSNDVYQALIGITPSGSLYNLPYTTTQYPVPTGSFLDYITTYVTASSTSSLAPTDDINKEQYKRIFHNLPLLLKKKGSVAGLRDLITTYGITDTILRINEFGGKDKNSNSFDNWEDTYNYAYFTSGSSFITSSWTLNTDWNSANQHPQALEFRFKTTGLPTNTGYYSQSLWSNNSGVALRLRYTGSGYTTASYSGGPLNPYYQYALLEFIPDTSSMSDSASVYLPFYNGGWWSVLINKNGSNFDLYAANKNYEGEDGNVIGFQASSSVSHPPTNWNSGTISYFGTSSLSGKIFSGSLQEIRYYTQPLSQDSFNAYVMNPYSIESSEYLAFRATLGGELYTSSVSVHPKVTGSWITTSSFTSNSNFYTSSGGKYVPNTEVFYFDQVPAGIQNAVSDKIKQQNIVLPYSSSNYNIPNSDVLSPFISVQQFPSISSSYTRDIDYVEVGFSPQNEINEDINSQYGYFNIGELIGDPRFQSSSLDYYPDLNALSFSYFEKYESNYDWNDYIRLIKFFDNSLFKMLVDWSPARTSLASGIIIKNTLLDRNRYRTPQVTTSASLANIGSGSTNIPYIVEDQTITGSIEIGSIVGSTGGSFTEDYYLSYSSSLITLNDTVSTVSQSIFLPQPGVYNIVLNVSSSNNPATFTFNGIKIYNGNSINGELVYEIPYSGYDPLNQTINFIANIDTQYLTFYNYGPSNTQSLQSINIYHYPGFVSNSTSLLGNFEQIQPNYYEFNGEVSGSNLVVTNGDLTDYAVITPAVLSLSPYELAKIGGTGAVIPSGLYNQAAITQSATSLINYDFNFDTTYYFSFTIKVTGSWPTNGADLAIVNSDGTLAKVFNATSTTTFDKLEVTGLKPNVFLCQVTSSVPIATINAYDFTVFKSELSNPNGYVIENDVEISRPSSKFMDVDFTTNAITAVNEQDILSGSATRATVPDSYYTTARIINPRYTGCETTSPTSSRYEGFVNQPMISGSSIGALANVEQYCDWFAYFDNISSIDYAYTTGFASAPRSGSAVHITSLININGERIDLNPTNNIIKSGSTEPNPLISNIPLVQSIFAYNLMDESGKASEVTPVSIRQYLTSGSINVASGSFSSYNVAVSGIQPLFYAGVYNNVYGVPNETLVIIRPVSSSIPPTTGPTPGLLIPGNFNPNYTKDLLQIAQSAGFFKNI